MPGLPVVTDASFRLSILLDHPLQKASLVVADTLKREGRQMVAPSLWAYDSYYLALAESLKCDLWTADKKLYQAAQNNDMAWVRHVSEVI